MCRKVLFYGKAIFSGDSDFVRFGMHPNLCRKMPHCGILHRGKTVHRGIDAASAGELGRFGKGVRNNLTGQNHGAAACGSAPVLTARRS